MFILRDLKWNLIHDLVMNEDVFILWNCNTYIYVCIRIACVRMCTVYMPAWDSLYYLISHWLCTRFHLFHPSFFTFQKPNNVWQFFSPPPPSTVNRTLAVYVNANRHINWWRRCDERLRMFHNFRAAMLCPFRLIGSLWYSISTILSVVMNIGDIWTTDQISFRPPASGSF